MNFYKITNECETHWGLIFKDGLNVDPLPFNPSGDCEPGGIYFSREDILSFLGMGVWIRKVILPKGEPIYKNPGSPKKYKARRVILGPRERITPKVIGRLLDEGANPNAPDALLWAIKYNHKKVVKMLLDRGSNDTHALECAARNGHKEIAKMLLDKGADPNQHQALFWAASEGHKEIMEMLLSKGANPKSQGALYYAAYYGHSEIVKMLLDKGADPDSNTLCWAARNGHEKTVKMLLAAGADPNSQDAILWAKDAGHYAIVRILQKAQKTIKEGNK